MGAEFLVAILWGVVVIYWVWSRRPAFGDSIGLFRNELHALEHAAPARVPPANRRRPLPYTVSVAGYPLGGPQSDSAPSTAGSAPSVPASLPEALAAASLSAKRLKARRRRRDVLSVLLVAVVVTAIVSVARRSVVTLSLQALSDVVLAAYAYLLVSRTRTAMARPTGPRVQFGDRDQEAGAAMPVLTAPEPVRRPAPPARSAPEPVRRPAPQEDWLVDLVDLDQTGAGHSPAHAQTAPPRAESRWRAPVTRRTSLDPGRPPEAYGDFDSYASLALAQAN
jgi:hypothetical protein